MRSAGEAARELHVTNSSHRKPSQKHANGENVPRRRRDPRIGTRTVHTLTAAQLERKRANDREAQRVIRQRTREHIEELEQKLVELDGSKDQLDKALLRNRELEAQITQLRQQISIVTTATGPQLILGLPHYSNVTSVSDATS